MIKYTAATQRNSTAELHRSSARPTSLLVRRSSTVARVPLVKSAGGAGRLEGTAQAQDQPAGVEKCRQQPPARDTRGDERRRQEGEVLWLGPLHGNRHRPSKSWLVPRCASPRPRALPIGWRSSRTQTKRISHPRRALPPLAARRCPPATIHTV